MKKGDLVISLKRVFLRDWPTAYANLIERWSSGSFFIFEDENGVDSRYIKVITPNGKSGWIHREACEMVQSHSEK